MSTYNDSGPLQWVVVVLKYVEGCAMTTATRKSSLVRPLPSDYCFTRLHCKTGHAYSLMGLWQTGTQATVHACHHHTWLHDKYSTWPNSKGKMREKGVSEYANWCVGEQVSEWEWVSIKVSEWEWKSECLSEWEWVRVSECEWVSECVWVSECDWVSVGGSKWMKKQGNEGEGGEWGSEGEGGGEWGREGVLTRAAREMWEMEMLFFIDDGGDSCEDRSGAIASLSIFWNLRIRSLAEQLNLVSSILTEALFPALIPCAKQGATSEKSLTTENVVGYIESGGAVCTIPDSHTHDKHMVCM